jgi:FkbM family methyltransferase
MSTPFEKQVRLRNEKVGAFTGWYWPSTDSGAWDGPKHDWETSHITKYAKYLRGKKAVVTAGANCGLYARQYATLFETVYAFEPDPLNFHCLVNNCQVPNIIKMQMALGATAELISVNRLGMENVGMHQVVNDPANDPRIPCLPLDDFNLPFCDLIQLDVEGYEVNVLKGARRTIEIHSPVIILENGERFCMDIMKEFGYTHVDKSVSDDIFIKE